jgi:hypothetical protein
MTTKASSKAVEAHQKKNKDNQEDGTYKKETKGICRETSKGEKQKWQASG